MMKNRKIRVVVSLMIVMLMACILVGFDSEQSKIYDDANLLTGSEESKLQTLCVATAQNSSIDIVIVTTDDNNGKSSMTYAEDFFMEHEFGYDKLHGDAVLMLIDMDSREVYVATSGSGITYFSDTRIDKMVTDISKKLSSSNYYSACELFINDVSTYMQTSPSPKDKGGDGKTTYTADYDKGTVIDRLLANLGSKLLISLAVSVVAVVVMMSKAKAKMTVGNETYTKDHQYEVRNKQDLFINTTVIKHKIQTNNNSSGGGSFHSGSGGHSFGGGGHKF